MEYPVKYSTDRQGTVEYSNRDAGLVIQAIPEIGVPGPGYCTTAS